MKKITLFLMSLFLTVGAMAQTFVAPVEGGLYKIKGDSQSHPWLTANMSLGGNVVVSANEEDAAMFERTANGLKAVLTGKYLGYSNGKYTYSDTELTVELVNTGDQANEEGKYAIKSGNNWMYNNNTDGIVHESSSWLELPRLWGFIEVEVENLGNSVAKAALGTAITNAQALLGQIKIGEGVGKYTGKYTAAEIESVFGSVENFYNSIDEGTPVETIEEYTEMVNEAIASYSLNMPEAGKCYRIMAVEDWNDDARYLGSQNSTAKDGRAEFVAGADDNTVFYFDGTQLKSNATGYYLVSNNNFLGYNESATEGVSIAFEAADNGLLGAYRIKFNGNRYLFVNQGNYTDAGDGYDNRNGYCFNIEEVKVVVEPENPEPENPDSENSTAVENVEIKNEKSEIYDLTGRKVENITKAGVYIVNGCKVLVK